MEIAFFDLKRFLKRTITSDLFNGVFICDGENRIRKDAPAFKFRQMFLLEGINDNNEPINNILVIAFEQRQNDIYLVVETPETTEAKVSMFDGNRLILIKEAVEHFISFNP